MTAGTLSPSARALQSRLRRTGLLILVLGGASAAIAYSRAKPADPRADQLSGKNTKQYQVQMELVGGKANILADDAKDGIRDLLQGKKLAYTLACTALAGCLGCFFVAHRLSYSTVPEDRSA